MDTTLISAATQQQKDLFLTLRSLDVSQHVEKKKSGNTTLSYLSWSWAWDALKQACPDATYEIAKDPATGLPYFESHAGAMVYTKVTAGGMTHEMWLPIMDGANNAMKREVYSYKVKDHKNPGKTVEKWVEPFTMFDVNKTLMRCLVKNLAMFGLGLYIYSGEDLPEAPAAPQITELEVAAAKRQLAVAAETGGNDGLRAAFYGLPGQLQQQPALKEYARSLRAPNPQITAEN